MLCKFRLLPHQWLCENCGRKVSIKGSQNIYMPTAKCRIPDGYRESNNFINKKYGVGDSLMLILSKMHIGYNPLSITQSKINFLNTKSITWCENNQDILLDLLKIEAQKMRIEFIPSKFKAIIRLAIKNSKRQLIT